MPEAAASIEFTEDGQVTGTTGCNSFTGGYTIDGSSISIGPLAATRAACATDVMTVQEAGYLGALDRAATWAIDDDMLTLSGDDGSQLLAFAPLDVGLSGSWTVIGVNNGSEAVVSVLIDTELTLEFGDDGAVSGNAGCNDFSGTYSEGDDTTATGGTLTIGPLAASRSLCAEPEGIMAQEAQYLLALEAAETWQMVGARLELRDTDGALQVSAQPAG